MLSIKQCLIATVVVSLATFTTRALPFILFRHGLPGPLEAIARHLPPMLIAVLLVYCFNDVQSFKSLHALVYLGCTIIAITLQCIWHNSMISIFGATFIYMAAIRLLGLV